MPHPTSYQDRETISGGADNECEAAVVNSDTQTGIRDRSAKRLYQWEATDDDTEEMTQDGFQLVQSKKKSKNSVRAHKSASAQESTEMDRQDNYVTQTTYRLSFPKGVSPRDRMMWLADVANKHRNLSVHPKPTSKSIMAVTKDHDTMKFLTEIGHSYNGKTITLTRITQENKMTKVFIKNYPTCLDTSYIEDHPSVIWAKRNIRRGTKEPRKQVIAIWEGEVPAYLELPGIRSCKIERYVGKPAFCGNCQKWGHRVWECDGIKTCGFCSQHHDTTVCKEKIQAGEQLEHKCPNCSQEHNAWSFKCPLRPRTSLDPREEIITQPPNTAASPPHLLNPPPPRWTPTMPTDTAAPPLLRDYPPLPSGLPLRPHHTSGHGDPPATQPTAMTHPSSQHVAQATSHTTPHPPSQETSTTHHHHPASTYTPVETSEPARRPSPIQDPTAINTAATNTQSSLREEFETLRQEVKTLKLNQEIMQKETQDLRTMVASLHVTLKDEMSSVKTLLVELANQTKIPPQTTAAASTHMEVDITSEQTAIPTHHHPSKQTPQGGLRNETGHTTSREDITNDLTVHLTNNKTHLPPPTPSPPHPQPSLSTSPTQPPPLTANPTQPPPLTVNPTYSGHSTTHKDQRSHPHQRPETRR